jgi:protein TonB
VSQAAKARANLASLFSTDDYPQSAIRNEEQGTTAVRLTVGPDGRVSDCSITSSSGSSALDSATCNILRRRARFTPAKDQAGNPISDSYSQRIRWELPSD